MILYEPMKTKFRTKFIHVTNVNALIMIVNENLRLQHMAE